jgi:hypothetical protein
MTLSSITRALYKAARISNNVCIAEKLVEGDPKPALRHFRNKLYFKVLGRFLK